MNPAIVKLIIFNIFAILAFDRAPQKSLFDIFDRAMQEHMTAGRPIKMLQKKQLNIEKHN